MSNRKERARRKAVREYENTPSVNPFYKGATPADVGRALLGKKPVRHAEKVAGNDPAVKSGV